MVTNDNTATAVATPHLSELPPFSLEAEQAVLGACLIDRDVIAAIAPILTPGAFYRRPHELIYTAIVTLWNRRVPADLICVIDELRRMPAVAGGSALEFCGGESYVSELVAALPTAAHAAYYADMVNHYAARRRNIDLAQRIVVDAYDASLTEDERISRATEAIRSMPVGAHAVVSMNALMNHWQDEPDGIRARGISTGIHQLDQMTGGLRPGQLVVIGARTGIGKSALAGQIAYRVARRQHVVSFLSLEMTNEQVSRRMVGQVVDVNIARAAMDQGYYERNLTAITEARAILAELPILFNDRFTSDLPAVVGAITRHRTEHNAEVAFVDYLGQMTNAAAKAGNRAIELGSITRALKLTALEQGICIVLLAQLNREIEGRGEGGMPRLSDLRDSGSTEQDADVVLLLHRADRTNPETTFYVAKNREGATGTFEMHFIDHRTMFVGMDGRP